MPPEEVIADGRLRKGAQRRQSLLDATLRLIGRGGLAAVTQRAVAAEAGLPPSAVMYYFPTIRDLIVATLASLNDRYTTDLEALPGGVKGVEALAALLTTYSGQDRESLLAENELWLLAARDRTLAAEAARWDQALTDTAARLTSDPVAADDLVIAYIGLYVRAVTAGSLELRAVEAVLRRFAGHSRGI
ncbi:MAG: TetR/AcrR family transcriptional regulator [Pseudonocardia sp.]